MSSLKLINKHYSKLKHFTTAKTKTFQTGLILLSTLLNTLLYLVHDVLQNARFERKCRQVDFTLIKEEEEENKLPYQV